MAVLCGGILAAAVMLACFEYLLVSGRIWSLEVGWLLSGPVDDWSNALWQLKRADNDESSSRSVFLFGGSSAREAITSDELASQELTARVHTDVQFVNLGTRNQTLSESVVLLENLPDAEVGAVVFAMQPMFLADGLADVLDAYEGTRYPLDSSVIETILLSHNEVLPSRSVWQTVRYRARVANHLRARARQGFRFTRLDYVKHLYAELGPLPLSALRIKLANVASLMQNYHANRDLNLDVLRAAIRLAHAKGYNVVVAGLPRNPFADQALLHRFLPDYLTRIRQLAAEEGATFVDFHAQLALPPSAFFDHVHVIDSTRPLLEQRLFDVVAGQLGAS